MIIDYFSNLTQEELDEFIKVYEQALYSNNTTFSFDKYTVTTTFANYLLKYYDYDN